MTRALVIQLVEALEKLSDTEQTYAALDKADAAIKAAREYLATEPSGERSELIQWLRGAHRVLGNENSKTIADMLETDAQQAKRVPLTDDEIDEIGVDYHGNFQVLRNFARAIESHLSTK